MKKYVFAAIALLASAGALAQGYVGLAGGVTKQDVDCSGTSSCDTSDTGYRLTAGYKFTPIVAVEFGYTDFGKVSASAAGASATYQTTSFSVGATAFVPLAPRFTGIGRLGIASNKAKIAGRVLGVNFNDSETNTQPYLGVGLAYEVAPGLKLGGNFDFTKTEYSSDTSNATLLSIGLIYSF